MGHAFEHCEFKDDSKTKRFGKKKNAFSGLDFFLQPLLLSRVVPAVGNNNVQTQFRGITFMPSVIAI